MHHSCQIGFVISPLLGKVAKFICPVITSSPQSCLRRYLLIVINMQYVYVPTLSTSAAM